MFTYIRVNTFAKVVGMARVVPDTLVAKGFRVARPGFEIRFLVVCQRFASETAHKQSPTKGPCCACQGARADCLCRRHFVRHCDGQERNKRPAGLQIPKARELDGKLAGFGEKFREPAVCGEQERRVDVVSTTSSRPPSALRLFQPLFVPLLLHKCCVLY